MQSVSFLHLLYHDLSDGEASNTYQLSTGLFRRHADVIARASATGSVIPHLTFDDGHLSNYALALPILQQYQLSAIFFITAGWTAQGRQDYMTWDNIRSLAANGHAIGAHGWSHKLLTHCNPEELQRELVDAKRSLEDHLGVAITALSFPGGRFDESVLQTAQEAGYTMFYTSIPRTERPPLGRLIGRVNVRSNWSPEYLASLLSDSPLALSRLRYAGRLKEAAKDLLGDRLYSKLWSSMNGRKIEPDTAEDSGT